MKTAPCFDFEPCSVIDALDMAFIECHELVFDELQRPVRMWARIKVAESNFVLADYKNFLA